MSSTEATKICNRQLKEVKRAAGKMKHLPYPEFRILCSEVLQAESQRLGAHQSQYELSSLSILSHWTLQYNLGMSTVRQVYLMIANSSVFIAQASAMPRTHRSAFSVGKSRFGHRVIC